MQYSFDTFVQILGQEKPPTVIWQKPFDYVSGHCQRLCDRRLRPQNGDLCDYLLDYRYMEVQEDLLRYLLPKVLYVWGQQLLGKTKEYGAMSEQLFASLAGRPLHPEFFNEEEFAATKHYVASLILSAMEGESSLYHEDYKHLPYAWFNALGSFMVVFADLEYLWQHWWSLPNESLALCMVEYASCLLYESNDNPIFAPWTPERGGGPPGLLETDAHIFDQTTHPDNIAFLEATLSIDYIHERLRAAKKVITTADNLKVLEKILDEFALQSILLEERLPEFFKLLRLPKKDIQYWW